MSTSGLTAYSLTAMELINTALRATKALASGETAAADQTDDARVALNMLLKAWQAEGLFLWTTDDVTLYLAHDTASYLLGPTGTNCSATVVETEVATAGTSGELTLVLDSITGMSNGDYVGIELDDGTMQWTTINGVPAALTITLTDALTGDVAVDNIVVTYTTKIYRPEEITQIVRRSHAGIDTPLICTSKSQYQALSSKTSSGVPTQYYYDPQLTNGVLYVWPVPEDVQDRLIITVRRPIEYVNELTEDLELPHAWYHALKWNIAAEIAPDYEVDLQYLSYLEQKAAATKDKIMNADRDQGSFFFAPNLRG